MLPLYFRVVKPKLSPLVRTFHINPFFLKIFLPKEVVVALYTKKVENRKILQRRKVFTINKPDPLTLLKPEPMWLYGL